MAEPAGWDARLTAWVDRVDDHWKALGVPDPVRARLRRELLVDLGQARFAGAPVEELVSPDPELFAAEVAGANE